MIFFIGIQNFSFTKMHLKISSAKRRPFCPGGDESKHDSRTPARVLYVVTSSNDNTYALMLLLSNII